MTAPSDVRPAERAHCPGCGRQPVILAPRPQRHGGHGHRPADLGWRYKAHVGPLGRGRCAMSGHLVPARHLPAELTLEQAS